MQVSLGFTNVSKALFCQTFLPLNFFTIWYLATYMHAPVISFLVALKNQISGVDPEKNGCNGFSYSPSHIL